MTKQSVLRALVFSWIAVTLFAAIHPSVARGQATTQAPARRVIPRQLTLDQCEQQYCLPDSRACYEKRCSTLYSGCRAPCTYIYNNPCLEMCSVYISDSSACVTAFATQATACFRACWQQDGDASSCADRCKTTATNALNMCRAEGTPADPPVNPAVDRIASVTNIKGAPTVTTNGLSRPLRPGDNINFGDTLKTRDNERITILFSDGETRTVTSNSTQTMERRRDRDGNPEILVKVVGTIERVVTPRPGEENSSIVVTGGRLPTSHIEYRQWSRVMYEFTDFEDRVTVFEGRVEATDLRTGERTTVTGGQTFALKVGRPLREATVATAGQPSPPLPRQPAAVTSSFANDTEGWTGGSFPDNGPYDSVIARASVKWNAGGGRSGGALSMNDPGAGNFFFEAPAAFRGDKQAFYGGELRYDLRSEGGELFDEADVILLGPGIVLVYRAPGRPTSSWATVTVPLTESAWRIGRPDGSTPARAEFERVLGNIGALRIRGEYRNGPETGWLSNVALVPRPGSTPGLEPAKAPVPAPQAQSPRTVTGSWQGTWRNSRNESGPWPMNLVETNGVITGTDDGMTILDGRRAGDTMTWRMKTVDGERWWTETIQIQDGGSTLVASYTGHDSRGVYTGGGTLLRR